MFLVVLLKVLTMRNIVWFVFGIPTFSGGMVFHPIVCTIFFFLFVACFVKSFIRLECSREIFDGIYIF